MSKSISTDSPLFQELRVRVQILTEALALNWLLKRFDTSDAIRAGLEHAGFRVDQDRLGVRTWMDYFVIASVDFDKSIWEHFRPTKNAEAKIDA